jgi:hypothetical protein
MNPYHKISLMRFKQNTHKPRGPSGPPKPPAGCVI